MEIVATGAIGGWPDSYNQTVGDLPLPQHPAKRDRPGQALGFNRQTPGGPINVPRQPPRLGKFQR